MELNLLDRLIIKNLWNIDRIILAPISQSLTDAIESFKPKTIRLKLSQSPMAVSDAFLNASFDFISPNMGDLRIGYIGSVFSAGHNQRIPEVIECMLNISHSLNIKKFNASFLGIEKELIPHLKNKFFKVVNLGILTLEGRQSQITLLPKLKNCNLFILPYPEGKYFENRFPLKALEYASLNRPILVSDTISHRNIFCDSEVWFYDPNDCQSLKTEILKILNNPKSAQEKSKLALRKAKKFSYINRVKSILGEF
jgi:glycosyltransferase involved in cell wall biosynthesis